MMLAALDVMPLDVLLSETCNSISKQGNKSAKYLVTHPIRSQEQRPFSTTALVTHSQNAPF